MNNITYKYEIGDWVVLKRKNRICDHIDEDGVAGRISTVKIIDRRDYSGPAYKFEDLPGYYKEECILQKCLEFPEEV